MSRLGLLAPSHSSSSSQRRGAPNIGDNVVEVVHHLEHVVAVALGLIPRARESTLLKLELSV